MELQETIVEIDEKSTWKTENFSLLNVEKIYSEPFVVGGYPWRILLYPHRAQRRQHLINLFGGYTNCQLSKG